MKGYPLYCRHSLLQYRSVKKRLCLNRVKRFLSKKSKKRKRKEDPVQTNLPLELPSNGVSHIFCKRASRQLHLDCIRNCT